MKKTFNSIASSAFIATLLFAQLPVAQAKLGSSSNSSSSSSSQVSNKSSRPTPSYSPPASSRVGGGNSVGMSRPTVMNAVRQQPAPAPVPTPIAPRQAVKPPPQQTYQQQSAAPSPQNAAQRKSGVDWKSAAVGAAGGAALTYALTRDGSPAPAAPAYPQQGYAPSTGPQGYAQPGIQAPVSPYPQGSGGQYQAAPTPAPSSSVGGGEVLLLLVLAAAGGYAAWRALSTPKSGSSYTGFKNVSPKNSEPKLNFDPKEFFIDLQAFNSAGDAQSLKSVMTAELFKSIESTIGSAPTEVLTLSAQTVSAGDGNAELLSVQYAGTLRENGEDEIALNEVWHFMKVGDKWLLAGIEQV